mmetsp:Transcript_14853/g.30342  ORF Transcript_14853/g.30342 Transcript_14853/m.30342 type:complete len:85 (-) Transcript_14853:162-416(-)
MASWSFTPASRVMTCSAESKLMDDGYLSMERRSSWGEEGTADPTRDVFPDCGTTGILFSFAKERKEARSLCDEGRRIVASPEWP